MRKLLLSFVVCGLSLVPNGNALAQGNPHSANASRYGIAVVDISYIFQRYGKFKATMEGMKAEMEKAEGSLKGERDQIQQLEDQRNTLKPGTDEFKRLDEEVARQKADFNIKAGSIRRDFLEREAKVYYETYLEVSRVVDAFARSNNIGLVLRFNGDQIDPSRREDVLRAINQPIMFQNQIDITPDVEAMLGGGAPAGDLPQEAPLGGAVGATERTGGPAPAGRPQAGRPAPQRR